MLDLSQFNPESSKTDRSRGQIIYHYVGGLDSITTIFADNFFLDVQERLAVDNKIRVTSNFFEDYFGIVTESEPGSVKVTVAGPQTLSAAGPVNLLNQRTDLNIDGTMAFTLENGVPEQRKSIICRTAVNTPVGTLTPTTLLGANNSILFNAAGDTVDLRWTPGGWAVVGQNSVTFS